MRPETAGFAASVKAKLSSILNPSSSAGLMGAVNKVGLGSIVGVTALTAAAVDLGVKMQDAQVKIQGQMDITASKAQKITAAFLTMSGSTFSGIAVANAFAPVSGVLDRVKGSTLTAADSLKIMTTAANLADATNHNLAGSTSTLSKVLLTYHDKLGAAGNAANILFNVSRSTGMGIEQVGQVVDKLHAKLGDLAPSLKDTGTLLAMPAVTAMGSRGVMSLSAALNHLLNQSNKSSAGITKSIDSTSKAVTTAQAALTKAQTAQTQKQAEIQAAGGAATASQQAQLQNTATAVANAQAKLAAANDNLSQAQGGMASASGSAMQMMHQLIPAAFRADGTFRGMRTAIVNLQPVLARMSQSQRQLALVTMFGAGSAQIMQQIIAGGAPAYDKTARAVSRHNAMVHAADVYQHSLRGQLEIMKVTVENLGTRIGSALIPKLEMVVKATASVVSWMGKHKLIAEILAGVIGGILAASMLVYSVNLGTRLFGSLKKALTSMHLMKTASTEQVGATRRATLATGEYVDMMGRAHSADGKFIAMTPEMTAAFEEQTVAMRTTSGAAETSAGGFSILGAAMDALPIFALITVVTLLLTHWKQVWPVLKAVAVAAWHAINNDVFQPIKRVVMGVVDFIKSHWKLLPAIFLGPFGIIITLFLMFHKQIIHTLSSLVHDVFKIGKDIIMGLWHGIDGGYHIVLNGIKGIGRGIIGAFKSVWHIFSPSKDFHDMGAYMMQGLANGITGNSHLATNALAKVTFKSPNAHAATGSNIGHGAQQQQLLMTIRQLVQVVELQVQQTRLNTQQMKQPVKGTVKVASGSASTGSNSSGGGAAAISAAVGLR